MEIGDPMEDTGKEAGEMLPETWRDRNMGTAQDLMADEAVILAGRTEITAEVEVREDEMVTKPTPPTRMDR